MDTIIICVVLLRSKHTYKERRMIISPRHFAPDCISYCIGSNFRLTLTKFLSSKTARNKQTVDLSDVLYHFALITYKIIINQSPEKSLLRTRMNIT